MRFLSSPSLDGLHVCSQSHTKLLPVFSRLAAVWGSGKTPHDKMYQLGILHGFRRLSKTQQQIIRNLQVAVRPTLHNNGNICHTHALLLRRQEHLLHEIRRSFLKVHAKKVPNRRLPNMPFDVNLSVHCTIIYIDCPYRDDWLDKKTGCYLFMFSSFELAEKSPKKDPQIRSKKLKIRIFYFIFIHFIYPILIYKIIKKM